MSSHVHPVFAGLLEAFEAQSRANFAALNPDVDPDTCNDCGEIECVCGDEPTAAEIRDEYEAASERRYGRYVEGEYPGDN
jgi:hypothetical protein